MVLGIPGLLLYATLGVAQWRSDLAMKEFTRLQRAHPPNSLKKVPAQIQLQKLQALSLADRLAPDNPETAYQTSLLHLVRAETESLQPPSDSTEPTHEQVQRLELSLKNGLSWINRAITLNPGYAEYQFVKASIIQNLTGLDETADEEGAIKAVTSLLHQADQLDPYKPSLHFRMGSFWIALGNNVEARNAFSVALMDSYQYANPVFAVLWSTALDVNELRGLVGNEPLARALLTAFLFEHGFTMEAEAEFDLVSAMSPLDYPTVTTLADYALKAGKPSGARMIIEKIDSRRQELIPLYQAHLKYLEGQSFHAEGRLQDAIVCFEQAIGIDSDVSYIHEALGNAYQQAGDFDRAIARYLLVLTRSTEVPLGDKKISNVHVELASAYEKKMEFVKAIEHYFIASQLDPTNIAAQKRATELSRQHL
jgi:tetratricopeptide (TPR) repeat protein